MPRRTVTACWCALAVVTSACGTVAVVATPLPSAPEPAVSPPAAARLPGTVLNVAGAPEGVAVDQAGTVAVNVRQPNGLVLFDLADPSRRRAVVLPGSARHLALAGSDGPLLIPDESDDRLLEVALPTGVVLASIPVGRQPHDAVAVTPTTIFVGDELADSIHIVVAGAVTHVVPAPLQPGGLAASPEGSVVVAVGVRARRITAYHADGSVIGSANCGAGPTHVVAGDNGLYWVADTNGGAVLGFRVGAHGPRLVARIAVGPQPYGIAYDQRRATLWVTLTGSDEVVGLRLQGTSVASRLTFDTVRQPNSVAIAESSGELIVTGSTPQGTVQLIPTGIT